jgi:hypothetical protein
MSALDREQRQFELDNPHLGGPEDMANWRAYLAKLKAKKLAESSPSSTATSEPSPAL